MIPNASSNLAPTPNEATLVIALVAMFLALTLVAEAYGRRWLAWVAKPVASALFVYLGLMLVAFQPAGWQAWIVAGLVLSWCGDVLLIPSDKRAFMAGLGAFLMAHVAYLVGFVALGVDWPTAAAVATMLAIIAFGVMQWLMPNVPPPMRGPVVGYVIAITAMVALAVAAWEAGAHWLLPAGAGLFYASDLAVARNRFVAPGFINRAWGLPAYYGGQVMLALTLAS